MTARLRRNKRLLEGRGSLQRGVAHLEVRGVHCEAKVKKGWNGEGCGVRAK